MNEKNEASSPTTMQRSTPRSAVRDDPASSEKGMEKVICLMGGPTSPNAPNSIIGVKNEDNNEAGTRAPKLSAGHLLCGPNNEPPPPPPMTIPPLFHRTRCASLLTPHFRLQAPEEPGWVMGQHCRLLEMVNKQSDRVELYGPPCRIVRTLLIIWKWP